MASASKPWNEERFIPAEGISERGMLLVLLCENIEIKKLMSKKFSTNNNNNFEIIRPNEEIPLETSPTSPTPTMKVSQEVIADEDVSAMFDLSTTKKKKKTKKKQKLAEEVEEVEVVEVVEDTDTSDPMSLVIETDSPSYDYALLLDRVINTLSAKNPDWNDKPRNTVPPPLLSRLGAKKTLWMNFKGLYDSIINDSSVKFLCICICL